jgi:hypothetical protein
MDTLQAGASSGGVLLIERKKKKKKSKQHLQSVSVTPKEKDKEPKDSCL